MCKVIAIANQKGGVAKTTTTVNLGVGLAKRGKRVLLIDGDAQGSLTASLGFAEPDTMDCTVASILGKIVSEEEVVLREYVESMRPHFDYILIDCQPSLGMMTINALVAADSVLIPVQAHFLSAKGLEQLISSQAVSRSLLRLQSVLLSASAFSSTIQREELLRHTTH